MPGSAINECKPSRRSAYQAEILPLLLQTIPGLFPSALVPQPWNRAMLPIPSIELCENRLLAMLSDDERDALVSHLEMVDLDSKQAVGERDRPIPYIYFPRSSILS